MLNTPPSHTFLHPPTPPSLSHPHTRKQKNTSIQQAGPNEQIKLVGNNKKIGKWDMDDAPNMKFNPETGLWSFATRIPVATTLEYKFVLITATGTPPMWC